MLQYVRSMSYLRFGPEYIWYIPDIYFDIPLIFSSTTITLSFLIIFSSLTFAVISAVPTASPFITPYLSIVATVGPSLFHVISVYVASSGVTFAYAIYFCPLPIVMFFSSSSIAVTLFHLTFTIVSLIVFPVAIFK